MSLTFDQGLAVAGFIVGAAGLVVAIRSEQKLKTTRDAKKSVENKLLHHMAKQAFETLSIEAIGIMAKIRERQWAEVAALGEGLGRRVGEVRGAWTHLLQGLEKDKLDAASEAVQKLIDSVPLLAAEPGQSVEDVQLMLVRCRSLVGISSEVGGRLSVESIQQDKE